MQDAASSSGSKEAPKDLLGGGCSMGVAGLRTSRPQGLKASRPQGLKASRPQGLKASRPQGLKASRPQGLKASRPQGLKASRPQGLKASRPQGLKASRPQGLKASRPQGFKASRLRSEGLSGAFGETSPRPKHTKTPRKRKPSLQPTPRPGNLSRKAGQVFQRRRAHDNKFFTNSAVNCESCCTVTGTRSMSSAVSPP